MLGVGVRVGARGAPSRVLFGPHETNLGLRRGISERHVAYYARRAAGGCGVIVTEIASVHESDWPYERAPLAADCGPGWAAVAAACHPHRTLVLAGLGHAGGQGSSAHSQRALWAPSRVPDVGSREVPQEIEQPEIDALVAGFAAAAARAAGAGLDGVEVNAGQHSILRQFGSGLTNRRTDGYGTDRDRLLREVLAAVRAALGPDGVLGLRLCADELAPWAGITPESAAATVAGVAGRAGWVDYLVPVRGCALSVAATRPDLHVEPGFNRELCAAIRTVAAVPVVLQGSVVDPTSAAAALDAGAADLVEMTRAQITEPDLVALVRAGTPERIRPCTLSNQRTMVRGVHNHPVSDEAEPGAGHELDEREPPPPAAGVGAGVPVGRPGDVRAGAPARHGEGSGRSGGSAAAGRAGGSARVWPSGVGSGGGAAPVVGGAAAGGAAVGGAVVGGAVGPYSRSPASAPREVLVVGGGPAGLEAARELALRGHPVRLAERSGRLGGALRLAAALPGRSRLGLLVSWWERELSRLGVTVEIGREVRASTPETALLFATGSRAGAREFPADCPVWTAAELESAVLAAGGADAALAALPAGPVLVHDPVGDWTAVGVAEQLAAADRPTALVTPDPVVGTQLATTGDLVPANARLARLGVVRERHTRLRGVAAGHAELEHVWTGERRTVPCVAVIDCGHRLPDDALARAHPCWPRAGDCVAPRTVYEAVREGRQAAALVSAALGERASGSAAPGERDPVSAAPW